MQRDDQPCPEAGASSDSPARDDMDAHRAGGTDHGVEEDRRDRPFPERPVGDSEQRGVAHRVVDDRGHRAVGPRPRIAEPVRQPARERVVEDPVVRGREAAPHQRRNDQPRAEGDERRQPEIPAKR